MKLKKRRPLRLFRPGKDQAEKIVNEVITDIHEADEEMQKLKEDIKKYKRRHRMKMSIITVSVIVAVSLLYFLLECRTFSVTRIVGSHQEERYHNSSYKVFSDLIVKYSKDGVTLLEKNGKERWNHSYQMATPMIALGEKAGVIADNGGNSIVVFQESGVRGEIHTNLPIEKVDVSEQGIVATILKEESNPKVVCYDSEGNLLVEHKIAVSSSGYPIEIEISDDGRTLIVSYLQVVNGTVNSKVVYYNFGGKGQEAKDYEIFSEVYENAVVPEAYFIGNEMSVLVGDSSMMVFHGSDKPVLSEKIAIDKKINNIFRCDKYIGMLLKNEGKQGYELRVYTIYGKQVFSENLDKEYSNITMSGREIMLYDNNQLCIYNLNGIKRFEGEVKNNISEITPIFGINKYLVMNANGMDEVQFVK